MARSSLALRFARFEHSVVLAVYTLVALLMSYPLVAQFGDHIAGVDGDVWSYLWAMGWARVSVLNVATNPFHTDYVFYPLGGATQLLWGTALPSFASIPLQLAFGLVPAFNLVYVASSVLTAYGMYLLAKQELGRLLRTTPRFGNVSPFALGGAAGLAGIVFAFGALRMGYGIAFTNLFHTEFIPFYILFLLRATRKAGFKNALLAGLFFALNVYIDFQIAAFLAVLTGLWLAVVLGRGIVRAANKAAQARDGLRVRDDDVTSAEPSPIELVKRFVVVGVVAGVLALPMLGFVLQDFGVEGGNYIRVYPLRYSAERSYDLLSYIVPNARSSLYTGIAPRVEGVNASVNTEGDSELSPDRQSFLGITVLVLAVIGAIRFRRAMGFWIFVAACFALLSLGPVLHVAGNDTNIPLPFALANNIPILNHIRIPMRYGVMVFFGMALLVGAGALVVVVNRAWLAMPLAGLVLLEAAIIPYPTLDFRVAPVYEQIARAQGDFSVLEIPSFNWRFAAKNEVYQAFHEKRILRAYTNRIAPDVADYFNLRQTPVMVRSLRILEGEEEGLLTDAEITQDRAVMDDTLNFYNVRYAVLHRDQLSAEQVTALDAYVRDVMKGQVFYQDDTVTGYRFAQNPPGEAAQELDFTDNSGLMYLGRGWQIEPRAEVGGGQGRYLKPGTSQLYLQQPYNGLDMRLYAERAGQSVKIEEFEMKLLEGWDSYVYPLSRSQAELPRLLNLYQSAPEQSIAIESLIVTR